MPRALSYRRAVAECKELWKQIEASGLGKHDFLWKTRAGTRWLRKRYILDCPLCSYANYEAAKQPGSYPCRYCPLWEQYRKGCADLGYTARPDAASSWYTALFNLPDSKPHKTWPGIQILHDEYPA